ncbi:MAG: DNA polymerase III subunit beta [Kiloniellales bacterium]
MKLTIERAALLKSLAHVQSVVERRNTIPILANLLLEAGDGRLSLTATDMDLTIVEEVTAEVGLGGATTVPAHTLYDIVRKLPEGAQVALAVGGEGQQMTLSAGRSTFTLQTLPKEDFPSMGAGELPQVFTLQAGELKNLIDRTRFAISTEETRYYLNGIYLHAAKAGKLPVLRAVATDGHRLARFEMPLPDGAAEMPSVIVPRKTVGEVHRLVEGSDQPVEVALSDAKIRFAFDSIVVTSKLIDGTFPDYERVIPSGNDKEVQVHCKTFAEAVDRVSTISSEKSRAVKLALADGTVTLSATSPENGTAVEEVEVTYGGPAIEIGFNARYLLDIAQQIGGETAGFAMADAASPTLIRDLDDASALYVLMPMRV